MSSPAQKTQSFEARSEACVEKSNRETVTFLVAPVYPQTGAPLLCRVGVPYRILIFFFIIIFLIDDRLYSAILRSIEQTHCDRMWFYMSDKLFIALFFFFSFLNIH